MTEKCGGICRDFEKNQPPAMVHEWEMIKRRWELDSSQPDPYQVTEKGEIIAHTNLSILTLVFS